MTRSKELFDLNFYEYNCVSILLNNILFLFTVIKKFHKYLLSLKESRTARRNAAREYISCQYPSDHLPFALTGKIELTWGKLMQFINN